MYPSLRFRGLDSVGKKTQLIHSLNLKLNCRLRSNDASPMFLRVSLSTFRGKANVMDEQTYSPFSGQDYCALKLLTFMSISRQISCHPRNPPGSEIPRTSYWFGFFRNSLTPDHDWALTSQVWARLLSEQYKQHTFWWTHAKVCLNLNRRLRHQASTALRNISANPDKTSALFALSLAAVPDTGLKQRMDLSETSRTFVSGEHDTHAPSTNNLSRIPSSGTSVDTGNANSNHQRTISEVTSLLTLVFQNDTLSKSGSGRQFFQANNSKLEGHRLSRVKQSTDTFCAKESYLNSLQVLTNTIIVMSNLLMASESMDDKNGNIFGESRYV